MSALVGQACEFSRGSIRNALGVRAQGTWLPGLVLPLNVDTLETSARYFAVLTRVLFYS